MLVAVVLAGFRPSVLADTPTHEWWVEFWAMPHVQADWGSPTGMYLEPTQSEMFMTDSRKQRVMVFDTNGYERFRFTRTYSDRFASDQRVGEPHDVIVTESGLIYLTDLTGTNVSIHSFRGDRIGQIDIAGALGVETDEVRAQDLALGPDGTIWVSTAGSTPGILGFNEHDSLIARIGYDLEGFERINQPTALAVDALGDLWIADLKGFPVIRHYSPDGQFLGGFGARDVSIKDFSYPSDILCADDGTLWISDQLRQAVKHMTADGEFIELIGGYGHNPGDLRYPTALAGNGVDEVYVCERVGRRIQRYYRVLKPDSTVGYDVQPQE